MKESAFKLCGVEFLQTVDTPNGKGVVQGILRHADGRLQVIVSHDPKTLPPELVPHPCMWKLVYYEPADVRPAAIRRVA